MNNLTKTEENRLKYLQSMKRHGKRIMFQYEQDELEDLIQKRYKYTGSPDEDTRDLESGLFVYLGGYISKGIIEYNQEHGTRYDYEESIQLFAEYMREKSNN